MNNIFIIKINYYFFVEEGRVELPAQCSPRTSALPLSYTSVLNFFSLYGELDLHQRHMDFQSIALLTELPPHVIELSVRFELTCPFGTRLQSSYNRPLCEESLFVLSLRFELKLQQSKCCVLTNYTNREFNCGSGRIRTY